MLLGLTNRCNLQCNYCFVKQNNKDMSYETAEQSLHWLKSLHSDDTPLNVGFFGGEPLIKYDDIIKPLVEKYNDDFSFMLTTNGVLLDEDKVDFFLKYNIQPLLSFDGVAAVQKEQRAGKGFDSYAAALNNIPYLLLRFPDTVMRMTLTKYSIPYLLDSIKLGVHLGFKHITFVVNEFEIWNENDEDALFKEFNKIGLYIFQQLKSGNNLININPIQEYFNYLYLLEENKIPDNDSILRCGLGTTTCAITPEGDIIPCQEKTSSPRAIIGNIYDGFNEKAHKEFLDDYKAQMNKLACNKCCPPAVREICFSTLCPSRLEDLNYEISSAHCAFCRMIFKMCKRLFFLCGHSSDPLIQNYFHKEDTK